MRRFSKDQVETRNGRPAVNVKYYGPGHVPAIEREFNCDESTAEQAAQYSWEMACESFWESAPELAEYHLSRFGRTKVWQEGRSGGWLVVEGLPDVDTWDAMLVSAWGRFEKALRDDVEYRTAWEQVREDIASNRWAESGAERYNFIDSASGDVKCIADLKKVATIAVAAELARKGGQ